MPYTKNMHEKIKTKLHFIVLRITNLSMDKRGQLSAGESFDVSKEQTESYNSKN